MFHLPQLLEHYILFCVIYFLATTDNQFGFKPLHGYVKLIDCNIPKRLVRLLVSWYRNQSVQMKWDTCLLL